MRLSILLPLTASLFAQTPAVTTAVLTTLTVKPEDRAQVTSILPEEVRATVRLYLSGKIQQWYSRSDGKGVVFILNCATVEEAKSLMDGLPLAKAKLATFEFTPIGPLMPLRLLVETPQK